MEDSFIKQENCRNNTVSTSLARFKNKPDKNKFKWLSEFYFKIASFMESGFNFGWFSHMFTFNLSAVRNLGKPCTATYYIL